MAVDFPNSPILDDTFTSDGITWVYNGVKWVAQTNIIISELSDVDTTGINNGDVLAYDSATGKWKTSSGVSYATTVAFGF